MRVAQKRLNIGNPHRLPDIKPTDAVTTILHVLIFTLLALRSIQGSNGGAVGPCADAVL